MLVNIPLTAELDVVDPVQQKIEVIRESTYVNADLIHFVDWIPGEGAGVGADMGLAGSTAGKSAGAGAPVTASNKKVVSTGTNSTPLVIGAGVGTGTGAGAGGTVVLGGRVVLGAGTAGATVITDQ